MSEETHVKDQLEHLVRLQEIDNRLNIIKSETVRIPQRLEAVRTNLADAQKQLAQSHADWEACNQRKRGKERDLETCEERLSKARNRQSEIKTNKEYQVHLQEIETLKAEKGQIEEELLTLMDQVDVYKRKENELAQRVKAAEQNFESERYQLERQTETLTADRDAVEKEREAVVPLVDPKLLKMYQQLKNLHRDLAVVPIQHGTCGGCHMNIPPQRIAEVKARQQILTCSQCQRILYWAVSIEAAAVSNEASTPEAPAASS
ncbi:MAG TPA: C4-type zinc ribbon domain-containing protein [Nitrospiria bacterium]|nr:C4-type zinc ribbon domain-containing protein [Nitrospiria bacterium]